MDWLFRLIAAFRRPDAPVVQKTMRTQAHRDYLDEAYQAGKLLISGPRIPRTGGVIIACVKTRGEDPFHKQGIADYEVIEFKAIKYQPVLSSIVRESEPSS